MLLAAARCCGARCWRRRRRAIYTKYRARALFVELERLNRCATQLDAEWGRCNSSRAPGRATRFVERVASERLHMSIPDPRDIEIVAP